MNQQDILISRYSQSSSYAPVYGPEVTDLFPYIQRIGITYCKKDYRVLNRASDTNLICYIESGEGILIYEGATYQLHPNQVFIIDCHQPHSYYPNPKQPFVLNFLHYNGPMATTYTRQIIKQTGVLYATEAMADYVYKALQTIKSFCNIDTRDDYLEIASEIHSMLMTFLKLSDHTTASSSHLPSYLHFAKHYIEENFTTPINVKDLSVQASVSQYHFSREFKKHLGQTPYEYLQLCRLRHAKHLLLNTDLSVSDISDFLHFNSDSHFIYFFKKRESITPRQFRVQNLHQT